MLFTHTGKEYVIVEGTLDENELRIEWLENSSTEWQTALVIDDRLLTMSGQEVASLVGRYLDLVHNCRHRINLVHA